MNMKPSFRFVGFRSPALWLGVFLVLPATPLPCVGQQEGGSSAEAFAATATMTGGGEGDALSMDVAVPCEGNCWDDVEVCGTLTTPGHDFITFGSSGYLSIGTGHCTPGGTCAGEHETCSPEDEDEDAEPLELDDLRSALSLGDGAEIVRMLRQHPKRLAWNESRRSLQVLGCSENRISASFFVSHGDLAARLADR